MIDNKQVDCYDLKTGKKTQFDNYYLMADHFKVKNRVAYKAIQSARPLNKNRYYVIFSDECVINRRFILASQTNYYKTQLLSKKDRIDISQRRSTLYKIGKNYETKI
tara:strand:+ start:334 stop:654 length:321 start_codon:yes stop_codon:yes gene_type:complete